MNDIDDIVFGVSKPIRIEENPMANKKKSDKNKVVGLDVGTGWVCSAYNSGGKTKFTPLRSCFYRISEDVFGNMFNKNSMKYIKKDNNIFLIGEDAMTLAKINNTVAMRPLSKGIINPNERSSAFIIKEIIRYCIEQANPEPGAKVVFSIPAGCIEDEDKFNTEYHKMSLSSLISSLGYNPLPLNEAYAVIISELSSKETTGLGFSFGAGLVNVAFVYKGMLLFEFSINKSGDFIDKESARATGVAESMINHIKERELDLSKNFMDASVEERALIISHTHVIKNAIKSMVNVFNSNNSVNIIDPIPIVISGGTSLPPGFIDIFKNEFSATNIPFKYTDIITAKDQLTAVANGCLLYAINKE